MVGGHAAAREPVEEDGDAAAPRRARAAPLAAPPVEVGAGHDHRPLGLAQQRDGALERAPVGAAGAGGAGTGSGSGSSASMNTWSSGRSRNVGPAWGRAATASASSTRPGISAVAPARLRELDERADERHVVDLLQRALPQRIAGARPPSTSIGEWFCCAEASALMPFVTPGPAVSAHTPGSRVTFAQPSAAKAADCSWRTSTSVDALPPTAVVEGEQMPAGEGEELPDAVRLEPPGDQAPAVQRLRLLCRLRHGARTLSACGAGRRRTGRGHPPDRGYVAHPAGGGRAGQ